MLEVTVSDETGWEFDTARRFYSNVGLDSEGKETYVAWNIVRQSPRSTALKPNEVRREQLDFPVSPEQGRVFTVRAKMLYRFAPAQSFGAQSPGVTMEEAFLKIPGQRPS